MINCLLNEKKILSNNMKINFTYDLFMESMISICSDIKVKYGDYLLEIGIIGIARGGLPMVVTASHILDKREISMIQMKMSNSNSCHDYGEVKYLNDNLNGKFKKYIIFEDIVYKGKTTDAVIDNLKNRGIDVIAVYTLIIDEGFKELCNNEVELNYCYTILEDAWTFFLWEKDLRGEKNEKNYIYNR